MGAKNEVANDRATLLQSAGTGFALGVAASVLSHVSALPLLYTMLFVYAPCTRLPWLQGWRDLCALLVMFGTLVLDFMVYEVLNRDVGLVVSIGAIAAALVLIYAYTVRVVRWVAQRRARVLAGLLSIDRKEARALPFGDHERWEEPYFWAMRTMYAAGKIPWGSVLKPLLWVLVGLALLFWVDHTVVVALASCLTLFGFVLVLRNFGYLLRLTQPGTQGALARDSRRPVLLLRPFSMDKLDVSSESDPWYSVFDVTSSLLKRTFEQLLIKEFSKFGPAIAIGRPGEGAAPLGAAREYANDDEWQGLVIERARASQLVLMIVDATPGLAWEIENVTKEVGLSRTVVVLPPADSEARSEEWHGRWSELAQRFAFLPDVAEDTIGIVFDRANRPKIVGGAGSSLKKQLSALRRAWVETTAPSTEGLKLSNP